MDAVLATGSGLGMVAGGAIGVVFDPMLASSGVAMVLGAIFGIVLGAGIAAVVGRRSQRSG